MKKIQTEEDLLHQIHCIIGDGWLKYTHPDLRRQIVEEIRTTGDNTTWWNIIRKRFPDLIGYTEWIDDIGKQIGEAIAQFDENNQEKTYRQLIINKLKFTPTTEQVKVFQQMMENKQ